MKAVMKVDPAPRYCLFLEQIRGFWRSSSALPADFATRELQAVGFSGQTSTGINRLCLQMNGTICRGTIITL
jgi:hypothetical protein